MMAVMALVRRTLTVELRSILILPMRFPFDLPRFLLAASPGEHIII